MVDPGRPQTHHPDAPPPGVEKCRPVRAMLEASTTYADACVLLRRLLSVEALRE